MTEEVATDELSEEVEQSQGLDENAEQSEESIEVDPAKQYKELHGDYTKKTQELAEMKGFLEAFGGKEGLRETLDKLQNPEVKEDDFGLPDKSTLEPEQREAYELVERIAEDIANKKIKAMQESYDPKLANLQAGAAEQAQVKIQGLFKEMSGKYPGWEEMQTEMGTISKGMNITNPTLSTLEQLYAAALQKTGKLEDFGRKLYEKRIAEKQNMSVDTPSLGSPGKNGGIKIDTIQDALRAAKAQLGIKEI